MLPFPPKHSQQRPPQIRPW